MLQAKTIYIYLLSLELQALKEKCPSRNSSSKN